MQKSPQKSNFQLHITPEETPIIENFFKDEFTYYTSISYKDPQNYIMAQNGVGFIIIKQGKIAKTYKNSESKKTQKSLLKKFNTRSLHLNSIP